MLDFPIIHLLDAILPSRVRPLPGTSPKTISITGVGMDRVETVIFNDTTMPASSIRPITPYEIQVVLPEGFEEVIHAVEVLGGPAASTSLGRVVIGVRASCWALSGTALLVQRVVKALLQTRGSSVFSPAVGSTLSRLLGSTIDLQSTRGISSSLSLSLAMAEDSVKAIQRGLALTTAERLAALVLDHYYLDVERGELYAIVKIVSEAGTTALVGLEL